MNKLFVWKDIERETRFLSSKERAYILDKISNSSYYSETFGELSAKDEERLIISIFTKIQAMQG